MTKYCKATVAAFALVGLIATSGAYADTYAPRVGSEAGATVPNALPGNEAPHPISPGGHLTAPRGTVPTTGSARGATVGNALP